MSSDIGSNGRKPNWLAVGGIAASILFLGASVAPFLFVSSEASSWLQNLGNAGQLVSGIFAPLAFAGVVVAVVLQSRELRLQREELVLTREEMKNTREVFELQKEEMRRAADENREQTRIMNDNLRNEGERQIYNEVDIMLYSLASYMAANWTRAVANNRYVIEMETLEKSLNRDNSDRAFPSARNSLELFVANSPGRQYLISQECGEFLDHCRNQMAFLCEDERLTKNRLASVRIESLGLRPILGLLRSIKAS